MTSFLIPSLAWRSIYRNREREKELAGTIHNLSTKFTPEILTDDAISNLSLPWALVSWRRHAFIDVTCIYWCTNLTLCVCFSCGQRRCFTIRRHKHWRWTWNCSSQTETGSVPSCHNQRRKKSICGMRPSHEHTHTPQCHITLPVVREDETYYFL